MELRDLEPMLLRFSFYIAVSVDPETWDGPCPHLPRLWIHAPSEEVARQQLEYLVQFIPGGRICGLCLHISRSERKEMNRRGIQQG